MWEFWSKRSVVVEHYNFYSNKIKGGKYTFAVLADMHNQAIEGIEEKLEGVDAIFIPGDLVFNGEEQCDVVLDILPRLVKIAPVYYSLGNHECKCSEDYYDKVRACGVSVLNGTIITHVREDIILGGILRAEDKMYQQTVRLLNEGKEFSILLCHCPEIHDKISDQNIDLILSGHTHGGQIRFFGRGLYAPGQGFFPKYSTGLYDGKLLVSPGLSNPFSYIPRINNPYKLFLVGLCGCST